MAKPFRIIFNVPKSCYNDFVDIVIWNKIKHYSAPKLLSYINKYLNSVKHLHIIFTKLEKTTLGTYDYNETHDWINLADSLRVDELPTVIIHELLHAVFPEIEDDKYILRLEKRVFKYVKELSKRKTLNNLMRKVFLNGRTKYRESPNQGRSTRTKRTTRNN